jgi:hypothetical protein
LFWFVAAETEIRPVNAVNERRLHRTEEFLRIKLEVLPAVGHPVRHVEGLDAVGFVEELPLELILMISVLTRSRLIHHNLSVGLNFSVFLKLIITVCRPERRRARRHEGTVVDDGRGRVLVLQVIIVEGSVGGAVENVCRRIACRFISLFAVSRTIVVASIVVEERRVRLLHVHSMAVAIRVAVHVFLSRLAVVLFLLAAASRIHAHPLVHDPVLQFRYERENHVEGVGANLPVVSHVAFVVSVGREEIDGEPRAILDLVSCAWTEFRLDGDVLDDVQSRVLIVTRLSFDEVIRAYQMTAIEARLFVHLSHCALHRILVLVHFSLGERPGILRKEGLDEQAVLHVRREHDCAVGWH